MTNSQHDMKDTQDWGACPSGELQNMVARLHRRDQARRQASAVKVSGVVAMGVALLVVSVGLLQSPQLEPMTCLQCVAQFESLENHLTESGPIDAALLARMEQHLQGCDDCSRKFEMMYPGLLQQLAAAKPSAADLLCFALAPSHSTLLVAAAN